MDQIGPDVAVGGKAPEVQVPSVGGDLPSVSVPDVSGNVTVPSISGDVSGAVPSVDAAVPSVGAAGESQRRISASKQARARGCR